MSQTVSDALAEGPNKCPRKCVQTGVAPSLLVYASDRRSAPNVGAPGARRERSWALR